MQTTHYTIPEGVHHMRADKALSLAHPELSRSYIQKFFDTQAIFMGTTAITQKHKVSSGDVVSFIIPEPDCIAIHPVEMALDIIFEDADIVVVNKAPDIIVHPGNGITGTTLVHGLLAHTQGTLSPLGGDQRPGIVHRLDKETSGLIVFAKTNAAYLNLIAQFAERVPQKYYLALVMGSPKHVEGTLQNNIHRHPQHRYKMSIQEEGRFSHTDWTCLERFNKRASLVQCQIFTGRTHQIRVQMSHMGHPILGDTTYGFKQPAKLPVPPRVLLHSHTLTLNHPITGDSVTFTAPIPADFQAYKDLLANLEMS